MAIRRQAGDKAPAINASSLGRAYLMFFPKAENLSIFIDSADHTTTMLTQEDDFVSQVEEAQGVMKNVSLCQCRDVNKIANEIGPRHS